MIKAQLNTRSIARIAAIQTLYQYKNSNNKIDIETLLFKMIDFYKNTDIKSDYELDKENRLKLRLSYSYLKELVKFTYENLEEIDIIIHQHLSNKWTLKSLPKLLFATLRVAICEIKYFPETPQKVILSEYTDIAADMLGAGEIGFVNSILDNYATSNR